MTGESTVATTTAAVASAAFSGKPEPVLKHTPPKRKKTWGEHLFNWSTYGGVAMLGNEVVSLGITEATKERAEGKYNAISKAGRWLYEKFEAPFTKLNKHTTASKEPRLIDYVTGNPERLVEKTISNEKKLVKLAPRLPFLLVATIGGMFMVPFVKWLEDHKGELVRKADRAHYGELSDTDPKLIEAHQEMDEAPKQSWGSLWKGRFTTVFAAAAADFTFGWDNALTTKMFGKNASLNGLARGVASKFPEKYRPVADNATWLLTLSSTLTVLFYASSKLFAKKHEEKIERKQEQRAQRSTGIIADSDEVATPEAPTLNHETPTPQVNAVTREDTLATAPQQAHSV